MDTPRTYHGYANKESVLPFDVAELVELRAHQRTFDNAYIRVTTATLTYGVLVLKMFDSRFYTVGLVYTILAGFFTLLAYGRRRHWIRWFSDQARESCTPTPTPLHAPLKRVWGAPFVTAGWLVLIASVSIMAAELALFVILVRINGHPEPTQ